MKLGEGIGDKKSGASVNQLTCIPVSNRAKNIIYALLVLTAMYVVMKVREHNAASIPPSRLEGSTMGTSWHVTLFDPTGANHQRAIDSILLLVNRCISTWDSTSEISAFSRSQKGIAFRLPYFRPPLLVSEQVFRASGGAYDPTVMPLVNAWGFGPEKITNPDTVRIRSTMEYVGFGKIRITKDSVIKSDPRVQLDFSAIGQGYGADVVMEYLRSKGITNMLVELGGEGMAMGINTESGKPWELGLVDPRRPERFIGYLHLKNKSFSTSGNYFNYREVNGVRYSHTIDPATGFPAEKAIMSATVFASDCATADAWATAFMTMGHEQAIKVLETHPELDACLLWSVPSKDGMGIGKYVTKGAEALVTFEKDLL